MIGIRRRGGLRQNAARRTVGSQRIMDFLPDAVVFPLPKDAVDRAPVGEIGRKHSPPASGSRRAIGKGTVPFSSDENWDSPPVVSWPVLKDCIDHPTSANRLAAPLRTLRQQLSNHLPLSVRQITGIMSRPLSSRHNMVSFVRFALCSLFLFSFDLKSVTIFNRERRLQCPSQNRTCRFPTSGSSVKLTQQTMVHKGCALFSAAAVDNVPNSYRTSPN